MHIESSVFCLFGDWVTFGFQELPRANRQPSSLEGGWELRHLNSASASVILPLPLPLQWLGEIRMTARKQHPGTHCRHCRPRRNCEICTTATIGAM